jgi:uncharacterized protein (TIGR02391 family)
MNTDGVEIDWVREKLTQFVNETRAVSQSSRDDYTPRTEPACGRDIALSLAEVIRPIFERLYPEWWAQNAHDAYDEFRTERDAAKKLLARLETYAETQEKLGGGDASPRITAASLHPLIWRAAEAQWSTGHRHEAVLAAAKVLNSMLQTKLGRRDTSEGSLVRQAFTANAPEPGKPRLRFPHMEDEQTRSSMQQGVMEFGAGCFAAIRNPVGHRPNDELELDDQTALERLAALSLLARWIDEAQLDTAPGG